MTPLSRGWLVSLDYYSEAILQMRWAWAAAEVCAYLPHATRRISGSASGRRLHQLVTIGGTLGLLRAMLLATRIICPLAF